jgi:hypothetical protein
MQAQWHEEDKCTSDSCEGDQKKHTVRKTTYLGIRDVQLVQEKMDCIPDDRQCRLMPRYHNESHNGTSFYFKIN